MFHRLLAQLVRDSKVPQAAVGGGGCGARIYLHQKGYASMAFNNEQKCWVFRNSGQSRVNLIRDSKQVVMTNFSKPSGLPVLKLIIHRKTSSPLKHSMK